MRILLELLPGATAVKRDKVEAQLAILWRRARLIRTAILLASLSALFAALLVIVIFFTALWGWETGLFIGGLFMICMLCVSGSLIYVILDINQSLAALKLELAGERD